MGVAYIFYNTGIRRRTDMKVGFIGGGNMASAMIGGMIQKGVVSADDILVSVRTEKSVERLTNQFGVQATMENEAVVAEGMPRKQAYEFAAQSVLGSAKMLLETGMHPGELKDMVCSPGGTTIEAVAVLERENLRSAVIDATRACIRKSKGVD